MAQGTRRPLEPIHSGQAGMNSIARSVSLHRFLYTALLHALFSSGQMILAVARTVLEVARETNRLS